MIFLGLQLQPLGLTIALENYFRILKVYICIFRLPFHRNGSWSVGLLPSERHGLFLIFCLSFCLVCGDFFFSWADSLTRFKRKNQKPLLFCFDLLAFTWVSGLNCLLDSPGNRQGWHKAKWCSGRRRGSWLPLSLAGYCRIALLFHGTAASGERI